MPRSRRVALKLDLKWPLKRHALIFAGTQRYADEHGWESIIDEYAAENLAERTTKRASPPDDGLIGRVNSKLGECARRLRIPLVNVWFNSPACDQLPGVFPDMAAAGKLQAEHLLGRGLRRFAVRIPLPTTCALRFGLESFQVESTFRSGTIGLISSRCSAVRDDLWRFQLP